MQDHGMSPHVTPDRAERDRAVSRVLRVTLGLNFLVAVLKLVFGLAAGAVSMVADGFHSILDGSSNIVGLVGLNIARKGPDKDHPYGHRKFEALAALAISIFLFLSCYEIVTQVIGRFGSGHIVEATPLTFGIMGFTMLVNFWVSRYESRQGEKWRSMILLADAKHTRSDVFASAAVLVSLVASRFDLPAVDLITALGLAGFIAYSGYQIVSGAFSVLSDSQVVDPAQVVEVATGVAGVTDAHRVRSRGLPDDVHVDLHVHVDPQMRVSEAHDLAHHVSDRIKDSFPGITDVVVHIEPEDEHAH